MCWESADCNVCGCQTAGHLRGCICSPSGMGIYQSDIESLSRVGMVAALLWTAARDFASASLLSPTCLEKAKPPKDGTWSRGRAGLAMSIAFQYRSVSLSRSCTQHTAIRACSIFVVALCCTCHNAKSQCLKKVMRHSIHQTCGESQRNMKKYSVRYSTTGTH